MNDLYPQLAELLEVETVNPTDVLADFELWDSLTKLSLIAMLGSKYGVTMTADGLNDIRTAADLEAAIRAKRPG
jgi:acyl carrier protein